MVDAMTASNLSCQQQCLNTPSMSPHFIDEFGYLAETAATNAVISGTYICPPHIDPYLAEFLVTLSMPAAVRPWAPLTAQLPLRKTVWPGTPNW